MGPVFALIDSGSFGKVYLACHTLTKTKVSRRESTRSNSVGCDQSSRETRDRRFGKRNLPSSKTATSSHHETLRSNTYGEICLAGSGVLSWYYCGYCG